MRNVKRLRFPFAAGLAALLLALPFLYRSASAQSSSQAAAQPADGTVTTTLADQSDLALTVYNSNLSLVRDVRQLTLPAGESRSAVHGHRRVHQSGDRAFSLDDRARKAERTRTELRIRSARSEQAAAEIRGPRSHAGAREARRRNDTNMTK